MKYDSNLTNFISYFLRTLIKSVILSRYKHFAYSAFLLFAYTAPVFLSSLAVASTQVTGTIPGQADVTPTGAASYKIPIAVPPGTAGMAPNLSLHYSSQNGEGYIGMGWKLNGLQQITRCPETKVQDGQFIGVKFAATDRFCLDGLRLVAINGGVYGADGTQYATEIDSFMRIVSHGSVGGGPAYFVVTTKSGEVREFGNTSTSKVVLAGISAISSWALDKVTDLSGNSMSVSYLTSSPGYLLPYQISYTANATASPALAAYNLVTFSYVARADVIPQYRYGALSQITSVLSDIVTSAGGVQVSDYHFTYLGSEGTTPLSQLASITLTGGTGTGALNFPATKMIWSSWSGTGTAPNGTFTYENNYALGAGGMTFNPSTMQVVSGDFNGDGKADYAILTSNEIFVYINNGSGNFTLSNAYYISSAPNQVTFTMNAVQIVSGDFNGDGLTDFAVLTSNEIYVFCSQGNGTFNLVSDRYYVNTVPNQITFTMSAVQVVAGDFNGDGLTDFAVLTSNEIYTFYSQVNGTFNLASNTYYLNSAPNQVTFTMSAVKVVSGDFNGDGLTDFAVLTSNEEYVFFSQGNGAFNLANNAYYLNSAPNQVTFTMSAVQTMSGDFNGDGLTDFAVLTSTQNYVFLSKGDGTFVLQDTYYYGGAPNLNFTMSAIETVTGDFNGDGKTDYAILTSTENYVFLSNGDGTFLLNDTYYYGGAPNLNFTMSQMHAVGGDFNGDGLKDYLLIGPSNVYSFFANGLPLTELASITNGLGAVSTFTYGTLANTAIYTKGTGSVYPVQDVQPPIIVVSALSVSNGISGTHVWDYVYTALRRDLSGRGSLGFASTWVHDTASSPGLVTYTTMSQSFPFIGTVTQQYVKQGGTTVLLSNVVNTWSSMHNGTTAIGGSIQFPYISQSVSSGTDLANQTLPTTTTTYAYDADGSGYTFGNPLTITTTTSDGFTQIVSNTYQQDTTNWVLNMLTQSAVTKTSP